MDEISVKGIDHDLSPGELFKGQRRDKLGGVLRHDHFHCGVLFDQCGCQSCRLVGSDSAGNAKQNRFSLQHTKSSRIGSFAFIIPRLGLDVKAGFLLGFLKQLCYNTVLGGSP